jgi:dolichyl-phosphate-mannose--protein O-mannosyl transferase
MKKIQRILAVIGILLLVSLYVATLVLALTDDPATMDLFRASIYCTVIVPVLVWAYSFIYKLLKNNYGDKKTED